MVVFERDRERASPYADEMRYRLGIEVGLADAVCAAVGGAELVITATPAELPLVLGF